MLLADAYLCLDYEHVSEAKGRNCLYCHSSALLPLSGVLGGSMLERAIQVSRTPRIERGRNWRPFWWPLQCWIHNQWLMGMKERGEL